MCRPTDLLRAPTGAAFALMVLLTACGEPPMQASDAGTPVETEDASLAPQDGAAPRPDAGPAPEVVCGDGVRISSRTLEPSSAVVDGRAEEQLERPWPGVDEVARTAMDDQALVGLAVGVIRGCEVEYLKGYGYADREAGAPVLGRETMFRWASMSKSVTGVVAAKASTEGHLDLDDPIETYYEGYDVPPTWFDGEIEQSIPPDARVITSRMLLGHLGGITHYSNGVESPLPRGDVDDPAVNTGLEWAVEDFIDLPLVAIPGRAFSYSTFGFNLMGVVLEHATDRRFADLADEWVATPAGMRSFQPDYEWVEIAGRAVGYDASGDRQGSSDVSWKLSGGGFISTVEDLSRFAAALMDDEFLTDAQRDALWTPQTTSTGEVTRFGLGFAIGSRDGRGYVEHSGLQQKAATRFRCYVDEALCIVVMSNSVQADTYPLVRAIEDAVRSSDRP